MDVYFTYAQNFDVMRKVNASQIGKGFVIYDMPGMVCTNYGVFEGKDWHTNEVSAAQTLRDNRNREIIRLRTEADRLEALSDPVSDVLKRFVEAA